jgi:hypothetical protein
MYCIYKFELSILVYSSTASNALNRKVPPQALLGIVGLIHSHSLERLEPSSRLFIIVLLGDQRAGERLDDWPGLLMK